MNKNFPIAATFIDEVTYDIPAQNWSNEQWSKDLEYMQDIGINTVVIMRSVFYNKCLYPSKIFPSLKEEGEDFIGYILDEAGKRDMSVYIGLYMSNLMWNSGDFEGEIRENRRFVKEILELYGNKPAFIGWYIPHETESNIYNIIETMGGLAKLCKENAPGKKVLISPFFRGSIIGNPFSPERTAVEWDNIWKKCNGYIDYCAFQDGTATLDEYEGYLKAIKPIADKYNIHLWANVETFERDVRNMFFPIPFDVLRRKIEIAKPYVEKMITFEFSHFLSPQSIFPSAHNLNNLYKNYYGKERK